ncbi:MAG: PAS domain S-box protein [Oscillatoriales cyanobacterium C42_A2020_001]|nr:PAS domain S-box protein [Leptolyngbyaceae cyanobacterium C42_A2020_001]
MTKLPSNNIALEVQGMIQQEARFNAFFAGANAGLVIFDRDLRYRQINEALAETNGVPAADHIGKTIREVLPHLADTLEPMFQNILDTGIPILDYELVGETPKQPGVIRYWLASYYPLIDKDSSIIGVGGVVIEISDRKKAENALKQSEERFRSLVEATSQIVWNANAQGELVTEDLSWSAFTGQSFDEYRGLGWLNSIHPSDRPHVAEQWEQAVTKHGLYEAEFRMRRHDGEYRYISSRAVPILEANGAIREWVGANTDITERKQAEILMAQAKEAAEEASRAKSEFLANMSHELRTPLNGIMGYAQILQRSKLLDSEDRPRIDVIYQCASHLLTLINDILDLSKIEAQKVDLTPSDFHFPAFLQGVAEMCRIRAELKDIQFHHQIAPELPVGIRADEKRLRQVLINLLSNAIKFTDKGSVTFTVNYAAAEKIRFEVRDTGIGIAPDKLQAIFQPFEQVGDAKRQTEGTGLGLAISQRIVSLMGSTIEVQSEPGVGSIFRFDVNLPVANEWVKTSQTDDRGQIIGIHNRRPKVVVVDDKWANRSVVSNLLSPIGFEVFEAIDGLDGWQKILEIHPDVVITDLLMPELDGFGLIKQIRDSEMLNHLIIIVSSASVFETDQHRSLEAGGNDFLPKPIQAVELLQKLQKHLKIEWIYEECDSPVLVESVSDELVAPPASELETLYELTMKGNFKGIIKQAALLEEMGQKYRPFAQTLRQLAKEFQDEKILAFIQSYR